MPCPLGLAPARRYWPYTALLMTLLNVMNPGVLASCARLVRLRLSHGVPPAHVGRAPKFAPPRSVSRPSLSRSDMLTAVLALFTHSSVPATEFARMNGANDPPAFSFSIGLYVLPVPLLITTSAVNVQPVVWIGL